MQQHRDRELREVECAKPSTFLLASFCSLVPASFKFIQVVCFIELRIYCQAVPFEFHRWFNCDGTCSYSISLTSSSRTLALGISNMSINTRPAVAKSTHASHIRTPGVRAFTAACRILDAQATEATKERTSSSRRKEEVQALWHLHVVESLDLLIVQLHLGCGPQPCSLAHRTRKFFWHFRPLRSKAYPNA